MAGAAQTIDIAVAWAEIERRQARLEAREQFRYIDRVPVAPGIYPRFWLYHLGYRWAEYASSPRRRLEICLEAHKWVLEHVPGDITGVAIDPAPHWFYGEAFGLGCELAFSELDPWIRTHPVQTEADLVRLERVDPADNRNTALVRRWTEEMEPLLGDFALRYADGVVRRLPEKLRPPGGTLGIFTLATDLRGRDIYLDLYERPDFAREFLRIVTDQVIGRYRWLQSLGVGVQAGTVLIDDSSAVLSPWLYREFVVPCVLRVVEAIGRPLRIHVDGPAGHLLPIYEELELDELVSFGWGTSLEKVRDHLGGRALLSGNLEPGLFVRGAPEDVYAAAMHALEILAPCGGFLLQEGANMPPEAKPENIESMVRAAEDFGLPPSGIS